jgi:thiosulfate dehydrogenase [quinone] large subunit
MSTQAIFEKSKALSIVRILFGVVWAIDAWDKWQQGFLTTLPHSMAKHVSGQLPPAHAWIALWVNIVNINPTAFAYLIAVGETAIAIGLLLGLFNNVTFIAGIVLSLMIWSTAEGFGGPFHTGATDIGTSIVYTFVFVCLLVSAASRYYSLDSYLATKLHFPAFLVSQPKELAQ